MSSDRSWVRLYVDKAAFKTGVREFIRFLRCNGGNSNGLYPCPCRRCKNVGEFLNIDNIHLHLLSYGMKVNYTVWDKHGEIFGPESQPHYMIQQDRCQQEQVQQNRSYEPSTSGTSESYMDPVAELVDDAFQNYYPAYDPEEVERSAMEAHQRLVEQTSTPLYPGSSQMSLETMLGSLQLKDNTDMTDTTYTKMAKFIKKLLPSGNRFPKSYAEVKKDLRKIGMGYEVIHACENGCMLFYKETEDYEVCPTCRQSRWAEGPLNSGTKTPKRLVRYFPLAPRLQRLYTCRATAKEMRWHGNRDEDSEVLRHPADGKAWKDFDRWYPRFASDKRNVRLALASDGFCPFNNGPPYSCWPVIAIPYNLPPNLCMRKEFNLLVLVIDGPRSPGKTLNNFMRPLIDELKMLWDTGVPTWDRYGDEAFVMHAAVMWTISDFPGLGMLGGIQTKGYKACPICLNEVDALHCRGRMCYQGARRWLPEDHPWRMDTDRFNGMAELRGPPRVRNGAEVHMLILQNDYAPTTTYKEKDFRPDPRVRLCWTHVSSFWELPYWEKCSVRHALDVMHIEKNVCDNIFGTVLGVQGKTKDDYKSRMSLKDLNIRPHLWPKQDARTGKTFLPQAPYAIDPKLRSTIFDQMSSVKYPSGYAGSLRNKIREEDNKFLGLKTHDCHIIMQRLLPVVIRPYVEDSVADALVELCDFFRMLCARELKKEDVRMMKENIVMILCKLEMIFPPAFFTIMVHLCIHLPDQVLLTGPVHYTWMFSTERQLGIYKRDIKNKCYPEACIAERHLIHECVNFINRYLHDDSIQEAVQQPSSQWNISVVTSLVKASGVVSTAALNPKLKRAAHWCVIQHCHEAQRFITDHRRSIEFHYPEQAGNTKGIIDSFNKCFLNMVREARSAEGDTIPRELISIAKKVQSVNFFSKCVVNGVKFTCHASEQNRCTQNSGVSVDAGGELFFGVLDLVVELLYENRMPVYVFWCKWFDTSPGNVKYDRGLTSVNCNNTWYADNPFIMAVNATKVFYIDDPSNEPGWKVVNYVVQRNIFAESTIASTDTRNPNYAVDQPYQEDLSFVIPISAISLDLRHVPFVYIPVDEGETSSADSDYVVNEDEDEVDGFNNEELSGSDVDIDNDVSAT